ncbi:MAG TPA: Rv3654c family TadE-like protein [Acidimicrobiia bacterium]|nr:Rv3654c family TadE-like protein [Acidimicrobiia bacterium]
MSERGSAAITLLGVIAVALVLAVGISAVGLWLRVRTEASAAADAAALAAAPVTFLPFGAKGTPTEEAARFARRNGARLVWCSCPPDPSWKPRTVVVEVERTVTIWPLGVYSVRARGRAEFVPELLLAPTPGN